MTEIIQKTEDTKFLTKLFYGLVGIASSFAFFLVLYWVLRLDSAITNIITNTYSTPLYFWPYVILTFGAVVLFGVNISLLVYRWRKFGPPKLKTEGGTGLGSIVGIAASACPVCGSTLLSAIGIAGGLAAFPLQGLELKALSFGFMALPLWLMRRDFKKLDADCLPAEASAQAGASGVCPLPKDHSFKETDRPWLLVLVAAVIALTLVSWNMLKTEPIIARALAARQGILNANDNRLNGANISQTGNTLIDEVTAKVLPEKGFQSKIALRDSVVKLAQNGVIDRDKFLAIYQDRGGLPEELKDVLDKTSLRPILLTRQNANYYVNLLWPLGLSNYMSSNKQSPILGKSLFNFASTGGWDLGKEENGGAYFNKFKIIDLTQGQEALVTKIAQNAYRPCCNNSTFYQDCNHGSALLGLLQLGAAQGLTEDELYREAVAFNSFWFPHNYIQTALYFKAAKNTDWDKVDPKLVMGKDYSSIGGWYANVDAEVKKLGLLPQNRGGSNCGV
ncbi:MAG: hypothetical protein HYT48_02595 [Candidatus Vogelbacteria bacterium]|nr:hypothetical protein [Candidatus Vogelbacteria bacterium]